jgi:hypothetical protein
MQMSSGYYLSHTLIPLAAATAAALHADQTAKGEVAYVEAVDGESL